MLRIHDISVPACEKDKERRLLLGKIKRIFGGRDLPFRIARHSLDARKKKDIRSVYTVDTDFFSPEEEEIFLRKNGTLKAEIHEEKRYMPPVFRGEQAPRVLVAGAGPAGLFAALVLSRAGLKPLLIEQGAPVEERKRDVEEFWKTGILRPYSNVQFGEGGAGTFSDGKLASGIRDKEGRIRFMLEEMIKAGADEKILYEAKPHIGTDVLARVVRGLREQIQQAGGQILFHTKMTSLVIDRGRLSAVLTENVLSGERASLPADYLIPALGHSARESFRMLHAKGLEMAPKGFAVGVRIQHPQAQIDSAQYGEHASYLPPADYRLSAKTPEGRGVYSFCMCPGGYVVNASSSPGQLCVNGMSESRRDGENANSALVVQVRPEDFEKDGLFGGVLLQEELEEKAFKAAGGSVPLQLWEDFVLNRASRALGEVKPAVKGAWQFANLQDILPSFVSDSLKDAMPRFARSIQDFDRGDAILAGVESRTSSPLRMLRDERGESNIKGIYPCGEGAGYAGGITSAAVDGIKTAEDVILRCQRS